MAADLQALVNDPDFAALPPDRQRVLATKVDPEFGKLPPERQDRFLLRLAHDPYTFAERREGLPPGLLKATESVESGGDPNAEATDPKTGKKSGARGLMQFIRSTGKRYGITDANWHDPIVQVDAAARFHGDNLKATKGDLRAAVARYGDPKETGYADKVLSRMEQGAGGPPAGSPAPSLPAGDPMRGVHNPLKVAGYRLATIAADYNALMHHWGFGTSPEHFKQVMADLGVPGAEALPTAEPQTAFQQATAYLGPLMLTTPGILGAGVLAQSATGRHQVGDAAEFLVGGVQAIRSLAGIVRGGREVAGAVKAAREGAKTPEQAFAELKSMRDSAARSELAYSVSAAARRQAGWEALKGRVSGGTQPFKTLPSPEEEFARATGIASGAPSPLEVGRELKATGRQRLSTRDEPIGAASLSGRASATTERLFRHTEQAADTATLDFERGSGGILEVQQQTQTLIDRMTGSRSRDVLAARAQGVPVSTEPPARLFGRGLTADESAVLQKLRTAGGEVDTTTGEVRVPAGAVDNLSGLMRLYAEARRAAGRPELYPTLSSDAKDAFYRITNTLGDVIRSEVQQDEKVAKLWESATGHVLEVREPMRRTARAITGSRTSTAALKGTMLGDPEHAFRVLRQAGPRWSFRLRQGALGQLLRRSKGNVLTAWNGLPMETRMMLAAPTTPRSAKALADVLARGHPIKQAGMNFAAELRKAGPDLQVGVDQMTQTMEAVMKHAPALARRGAGMWGTYHLMRGAMMSYTNAPFALYHLGTYAMMTRPGLVRALLTIPPQSVRWTQAAAALEAVLTPVAHAQQQRQQGSGPVLQPGQRLPAPAAGEAAAAVQQQPAAGGGAVVSPAAGP